MKALTVTLRSGEAESIKATQDEMQKAFPAAAVSKADAFRQALYESGYRAGGQLVNLEVVRLGGEVCAELQALEANRPEFDSTFREGLVLALKAAQEAARNRFNEARRIEVSDIPS